MVFNLSNRLYDKSKFRNKVNNNIFTHKVLDYEWEDHHSPPIHTLFLICQEIDKFLNRNMLLNKFKRELVKCRDNPLFSWKRKNRNNCMLLP